MTGLPEEAWAVSDDDSQEINCVFTSSGLCGLSKIHSVTTQKKIELYQIVYLILSTVLPMLYTCQCFISH